jgi:hypothetical protein
MRILFAILLLTSTAQAQWGDSPTAYDSEGNFIGNLNNDQYDPDSVSNPYGKYGSEHSAESINNPYGKNYVAPKKKQGMQYEGVFNGGSMFDK